MALQGEDLTPARRVPHLRCAVVAPRDDTPTVRRKADRPDNVGMPLQGEGLPPAGRVPYLRRLVPAPGDDAPTVWREADRGDTVSMPLERQKIEVAEPVPVAPLEATPAIAPCLSQQRQNAAHVAALP